MKQREYVHVCIIINACLGVGVLWKKHHFKILSDQVLSKIKRMYALIDFKPLDLWSNIKVVDSTFPQKKETVVNKAIFYDSQMLDPFIKTVYDLRRAKLWVQSKFADLLNQDI